MSPDRVLILGAGQAGAQVAISLRQLGFSNRITILGDEPEPPYQRPPLSKKLLSGEVAADRAYIKPMSFYQQSHIELLVGRRAVAIDRRNQRVEDDRGDSHAYDALAICTGTRARRLDLEGATLSGVHYLRTMADAAAIRAEAMSGLRVAIIGGGYIGLEVAASLRHLGCPVTVLEALPRVMARVVAPEVAAFYTAEHRRAGVVIETGVQLDRLVGRERVAAIRTCDREEWPAELVVIGIGAVPNDELARTAGLACDNGIVVDSFGATEDPAIWAAGDVTNHPSALFGRRIRLESVHNAMAQAKAVAAAIAGRPEPYDEVPWFWSDQYDLKLQIAGLSTAADTTLLRGDPASRAFSCLYLAGGRLVAVDAINRPADFIAAKRLIAQRYEVDTAGATDPDRKLGS